MILGIRAPFGLVGRSALVVTTTMAMALLVGGAEGSANAAQRTPLVSAVSPRSSVVVTAPTLTPAVVKRDHKVKVSGTLSTAVRRPVTVQRKMGSHWRTLVDGKSTANGSYRLHLRAPSKTGTYKVRVHAKAAAGLPVLNSQVEHLIVSKYAPGSRRAERAALLDLRTKTKSHHPFWSHYRGWSSGSKVGICKWGGVTCTRHHVTGLDLEGDYSQRADGDGLYGWLSGHIPASIGDLTHLQRLVLHDQRFTGKVPAAIKRLVHLRWLELSDRQSGPVPAWIGTLSGLQVLDLDGNLTGPIPASIANLGQLRVLDLGGGLTGGLPEWVGDLAHLQVLGLWGDHLTGPIPASIGTPDDLEALYLGGNGLTGPIPASIGNLGKLAELDLSDNQLSGAIPTSFTDLTSMQSLLFLDGNGCLTANDPALIDWLAQRNYRTKNGCVTNG